MKTFSNLIVCLVLFVCTALALAAETKNSPRPHTAKWIWAQGKINPYGVLEILRFKNKKPGSAFVLEGRIQKTSANGNRYLVGGFEVIPTAGAVYRFINGDAASAALLKQGVRIEAHGKFKQKHFLAQKIRIFQHSKDQDIEIEGPLAYVGQTSRGTKIYRVGALPVHFSGNDAPAGLSIIKSQHTIMQPALTNRSSQPSQRIKIDGKVKMYDNSRSADLPEEQVAGSSRRYGKLQTDFSLNFSNRIHGYSRVELYWRDIQDTTVAQNAPLFETRIRDLYLSLDNLVGIRGLNMRMGRQRFRDARTWLMDARLDAIKLQFARRGWEFAFAVSQKLGPKRYHRDQLHYIGKAYHRFTSALKVSLYAIKEVDQREGRDDPLWLAMATRGKIQRHIDWWAQAAMYSSKRNGVARRGIGYDAGVVARMASKGPFLTYHYAYGSTDDPNSDNVNERFRQPRLQLNYSTYGAHRRLYYYGSLLTPELSNLKFQAIGLGYTFSRRASIQAIWRQYRQITASKTIRSNSLGVKPLGKNTALGKSAEMSLYLAPWRWLAFSLGGEWFLPGAAFAPKTPSLFGLRSEVSIYF